MQHACGFALGPYQRRVLLLSFIAGLIWILGVPTQPFSDFLYYHKLAQQIASGGIWGDTYTAVGYPIFLAVFYRSLGAHLLVAKLVNLCLSLMTNLLVFRLLGLLIKEEWLRLGAGTIFVFFPANIYYNSILANEILFTMLLLLGVNLYFSKLKYRYILIGVITGLNSLIKPFFPAFFLVVLLTELISGRQWLPALKKGGIILGVSLIVIAPWLYRNYLMIGEFTYISNNGGIVLYINNNSQNKSGGWMPALEVENSLVSRPEYILANPTEKNKMLTQAAKQWIFRHPAAFLRLGLKRLRRTYLEAADVYFSFYGSHIPLPAQSLLALGVKIVKLPIDWLGAAAVLGFSLYYSAKAGRPSFQQPYFMKGEICLLLIFWIFTGIYFITEGQARYAFPLNFILIYFALRAGSLAWDRARSSYGQGRKLL